MQGPDRKYIAEIDELRGFAVLLVFFYHSVQQGYIAIGGEGWLTTRFPPLALLYDGYTAVSLLAVLSGFILAKGTFGKTVDYRQFIINRMLRIFPLMLFVNVFAIYANKNYTLESVLAPFFFLYNTPFRLNDATQLSAETWGVSVVFQFYLIAPFVFVCMTKRGLLRFLLPALALIILTRLMAFYPSLESPDELVRITHFTIVGRLGQFLIGVALAFVIDRSAVQLSGVRAWTLLVVSVAAMVAITFVLNSSGGFSAWRPWRVVQPELEALAWSGVIAGYIFARPLRWRPAQAAMVGLGIVSFSLYFLHWPMAFIFWGLYKEFGTGLLHNIPSVLAASTFILLPAVVALSTLSYSCVEKPFLDLRKRYLPEAETFPPTPAPAVPKGQDSPLVLGALVGSAALAAWLLWAAARPWLNAVATDVCERGADKALVLNGPFARDGNVGYTVPVPGTEDRSDNAQNPQRSSAVLCEDQRSIGAGHSLHAEIREKGGGRYSHWSGALYFSTPDNSDPNINGRRYTLILR